MTVEHLCDLARVSRAGYYRFLSPPEVEDADLDLRDAIQRIAQALRLAHIGTRTCSTSWS